MSRAIAGARACPDHTLIVDWAGGGRDVIDFRPIVKLGGVMSALADPKFFVEGLQVEPDGYGLGWPTVPARPDEVGGIDFTAESLWRRAHPGSSADAAE